MRVLIVRLGSMGDVLHALPAVAALRATSPDAHIGWAIERRWTPFLGAEGTPLAGPRSPQRPLVDRVHIVDTLGWRRSPFSDATWSHVHNTFRDLRAERYDLAVDFQGSIKSAAVAQFSGATSRIGFAQPREKPATMFYTHLVQPTGTHIIDQNLSLIPHCRPERGRESESRDLVFTLRTSASPAVDFSLRTCASSALSLFPVDPAGESKIDTQRFAILNPGAGWAAKQWRPDRYGEVARALAADGITSLVNYGPGEESLLHLIEAASGGLVKPISCTLAELIALTRRASLFIGGDTGPMHLAALLGVPVVALFGPTDPARNGPYSANSIVLRHPASRTTTAHSPDPDPGLSRIPASEVIVAARDLLSRHPIADSREPLS